MEKVDVLRKLDEVGLLGLKTAPCPQGGEFTVSENGVFSFGEHLVSDQALNVAASYSQIPVKFFQRCPNDVRVELLNYFFDGGSMGAGPLIISNNREIVSFSGDSDPVDAERAIDIILDSLPADPNISRFYATKDRVDLYLTSDERVAVKPGDLVSKGVLARFSPFGISRPEVSTYMTVLACTNGMLRDSSSTKFAMSRDNDPYAWLKNVVPVAYNAFDREIESFKVAAETRLNGHTSSLLRHSIRSLTKTAQNAILAYAVDEKPETLWDLMNIITYYASHRIDNPDLIATMMEAGGGMLDHAEFCSECKRVLE